MRLNKEQREALLTKANEIICARVANQLKDPAVKKVLAPLSKALVDAVKARDKAAKAAEAADEAFESAARRLCGYANIHSDPRTGELTVLGNSYEFRRENENKLILASIESKTMDELLALLVEEEK